LLDSYVLGSPEYDGLEDSKPWSPKASIWESSVYGLFDEAELVMTKRVGLWLSGFMGAAALFAVAHGLNEYLMARSAQTHIGNDGVERHLTPEELLSTFLVGETLRAIPMGLMGAGLLCLPLFFVAGALRAASADAAYPIAVGIGAFIGGLLSFGVWLFFGGWGPPFLFPAVAAGELVAVTLVAARRGVTIAEQSAPVDRPRE
jgi:hypothetical protein